MDIADENGGTINFTDEKDNVTISGYTIYKTQVINISSTVTLKPKTSYTIYYGFAGSSINSVTNLTPAETSTVAGKYTSTATDDAHYWWIVIPNELMGSSDTITVRFINGLGGVTMEAGVSNIDGYKTYRSHIPMKNGSYTFIVDKIYEF